MQITNIRVAHIDRPLGYGFEQPTITWTVEDARGTRQENATVQILSGDSVVWSKSGALSSVNTTADLALTPRTRYTVQVSVTDETGDTATGESWFETGKRDEPWQASWIKAPFEANVHPILTKTWQLAEKPASARIYAIGVGLFELNINGRKASPEVLLPFYNDYNNWLQTVTFDVTDLLRAGENTIEVWLGKGWYMGHFGFGIGSEHLYGDAMQLLLEAHAQVNGEEVLLCSDESWLCTRGPVMASGIYDGEFFDATCKPGTPENAVLTSAPKGPLVDRLSPAVCIHNRLATAKLLVTEKGERVLDFGQVMTGWVEFVCDIPAGEKVYLQFGELLQDGCFYRENLRSAKEEFTYISNGTRAVVRPHFTFYGFRYVKVEGLPVVDPKQFTACVIHSDLAVTGRILTGNPKLDRLVENAMWSQKGNFLDTPTDCPQRDERMGWTGDAQVFAPTACYNMYTPAFYRKYLHDMLLEQRTNGGNVPHVVPDVLTLISERNQDNGDHLGSCAWADAATVIPWTLYRFYGDTNLLSQQYENMTAWAEYIHSQDEGDFLWKSGFHFADWLALDNPIKGPYGATDPYYIASVYYFFSTSLCAKAAKVLGYAEDCAKYETRAEQIRDAIRKEYFSSNGRITEQTQTAMALAIYFDLAPESTAARMKDDLRARIAARKNHLETGFVGTYFLLPALTKAGLHDVAVQLLLNEDYPSWLYEVNMGATTIWERWNSVMPDGHVSDTGMNSMNHYAYGSVVEWLYATVCGLKPDDTAPGFKKAIIAPHTDARQNGMLCEYLSAAGKYVSGWERKQGQIVCHVEIPFDATATFIPETDAPYTVNGEKACGTSALCAGKYTIVCPEKA